MKPLGAAEVGTLIFLIDLRLKISVPTLVCPLVCPPWKLVCPLFGKN